MEKLSIRSENIIFALDFPSLRNDTISPRSTVSVSSEALENISQSQILVWPQVRAFHVRLFLNSKIHLERPRSIDIEISTGWNYISRGKLSLRAGSAGLRLHTADTVLVDGNTTVIEQSQPGDIVFGQVLADSSVLFRIPYGVENDPKEITVKVEVSFTTTYGEFTYGSCHTIPILLPLGVNVQDVFHQDTLFSKFTISTATSVPLRISKCHLQSSEYFDVVSPPLTDKKLDVFVRQPLSFVSKVCQKLKKDSNGKVDLKAQRRLLLEIEYHCLDQEINDVVEQSLTKSLTGANLQELSRLLVPAVLTRLRSSLSIQELEMVRMLDEIDIGAALESVWTVLSASVQPGLRIRFANWVKEWNKVCIHQWKLRKLF